MSLTLAVASLDLPRGSRAVLPSLSHPSAVHALEWNGLQPEFVDVDRDDWCLHAEQLDGRVDGVSLILATHVFGVPCDVVGLQELATANGAVLMFDAAQAAATWVGARHCSEFGDASVISLSATKILQSGEGAIAVFAEQRLADRFRTLRGYGMDRQGSSQLRGLNAKLSELHAAMGLLSLEDLEQQIAARRQLSALYTDRLGWRSDLALQGCPAGCQPTPNFLAVDLGEHRTEIQTALAARGIESRPYFPPLHLMPRFASLPAGDLHVTERLGRGLLALPLYSELEPSSVEEICEVICDVLDGAHMFVGK